MAKVIRCECGYVARGGNDEALLADAKSLAERPLSRPEANAKTARR